MTPMIWPISAADRSIWPMAPTACSTTAPLFSASPLVAETVLRHWLAPSAVFLTVAVIWSSAAAVSSSVAACCSVRRERSSAAWLISPAPERMRLALSTITETASWSWSMVAL